LLLYWRHCRLSWGSPKRQRSTEPPVQTMDPSREKFRRLWRIVPKTPVVFLECCAGSSTISQSSPRPSRSDCGIECIRNMDSNHDKAEPTLKSPPRDGRPSLATKERPRKHYSRRDSPASISSVSRTFVQWSRGRSRISATASCAGSALRAPAIRRQRNQHPAFQFLG
jgi:hypothetical protein